MHKYRKGGAPGGKRSQKRARQVRQEAARADADAEDEVSGQDHQHEEADEDGEVEAEPLMEGEVSMAQDGVAVGDIRAYAHRDIKPGNFLPIRPGEAHTWTNTDTDHLGNIMVADDGRTPILMDLGSLAPSPIPITSRALALQVQDTAAEHSTMPYRAPELYDVKTDTIIDTKVDIWSLGCTLYACLVGKSPFEARSEETGGSLSLCILGGDWRFPDDGPAGGTAKSRGKQRILADGEAEEAARKRAEDAISEPVKEIVRKCLIVEPTERPDVEELIRLVEDVIAGMPDDGEMMDD